MQHVIARRTTFFNCTQDVSCWLKRICPSGKMLMGLFLEKKNKNNRKQSKTLADTILIGACSVHTCPLYLTLLSSRPCIKWRGLWFLKTVLVTLHDHSVACSLYPPFAFIDVWCDSKFSALYCKLTWALNFSEFHPNHTMKLIELFLSYQRLEI